MFDEGVCALHCTALGCTHSTWSVGSVNISTCDHVCQTILNRILWTQSKYYYTTITFHHTHTHTHTYLRTQTRLHRLTTPSVDAAIHQTPETGPFTWTEHCIHHQKHRSMQPSTQVDAAPTSFGSARSYTHTIARTLARAEDARAADAGHCAEQHHGRTSKPSTALANCSESSGGSLASSTPMRLYMHAASSSSCIGSPSWQSAALSVLQLSFPVTLSQPRRRKARCTSSSPTLYRGRWFVYSRTKSSKRRVPTSAPEE